MQTRPGAGVMQAAATLLLVLASSWQSTTSCAIFIGSMSTMVRMRLCVIYQQASDRAAFDTSALLVVESDRTIPDELLQASQPYSWRGPFVAQTCRSRLGAKHSAQRAALTSTMQQPRRLVVPALPHARKHSSRKATLAPPKQ